MLHIIKKKQLKRKMQKNKYILYEWFCQYENVLIWETRIVKIKKFLFIVLCFVWPKRVVWFPIGIEKW